MTLHDYVRLFRRGWLLAALLTVAGVAIAYVLTLRASAVYTSSATVYVSARGDLTAAGLQQSNDFTTQRAATYAGLAATTTVIDAAAAASDDTATALQGAISAAARPSTSLIDITATGGSGRQAATRANAVANALAEQAVQLDAPSKNSPVQLSIVSPAAVPTNATSPRPRNNVAIGAIIGLALGVAAVVVAHSLDTRIRTVADLPRAAQLATVTSLPQVRGGIGGRLGGRTDLRVESFRHLRANLQFGTRNGGLGGLIAVAGVNAASDAARVAEQLAAVLGEIGVAVAVVDCDLRVTRPHRHARTDDPSPLPGVADVLSGAADVVDVIRPVGSDHVGVISAGSVQANSAQQLSTPPMRELLEQLTRSFNYVLLSCPPLVERSEASVVAALSRSTLLVAEAGSTTRAELLYGLELLGGVGVTSISLALDHVRGPDLGRTTRDELETLVPNSPAGVLVR